LRSVRLGLIGKADMVELYRLRSDGDLAPIRPSQRTHRAGRAR
jgi:hypothetical protein